MKQQEQTEASSISMLLNIIAKDFPNLALKEVAKKIGMSEKSFFDLKKGMIPKAKLIRTLQAYCEKEKHFTFDIIKGNRITIKTLSGSQNTIVGGDKNTDNSGDNYEREKYLLNLVVRLEEEKQMLKDEITKLKQQ